MLGYLNNITIFVKQLNINDMKHLLLRLDQKIFEDVKTSSDKDKRSVNSQINILLQEALNLRN